MFLTQPNTYKGEIMVLKMYSIRDQKSEVYNLPFFQKTHGEAERSFRTTAMDQKTTICQHPEDFDLYFLGEYDDNTGKFQPNETPQHILKAIDCIQPEN